MDLIFNLQVVALYRSEIKCYSLQKRACARRYYLKQIRYTCVSGSDLTSELPFYAHNAQSL